MRSWLGLKSIVRRSAAEPVLGTAPGAPAAALKVDSRPLGLPSGLGRGTGRLLSTASAFMMGSGMRAHSADSDAALSACRLTPQQLASSEDSAGSKTVAALLAPGRDRSLRRAGQALPASDLLRTNASHQPAGRALPAMRCAGRVSASLMPVCRGRQPDELAEPPRGGASAALRAPAGPSSSHRRPPPRALKRQGERVSAEGPPSRGHKCPHGASRQNDAKGVRLRRWPGRFRVRGRSGPCQAQQDHIGTSFHADCCSPYQSRAVFVRLVKKAPSTRCNTRVLQLAQWRDDKRACTAVPCT